MLFLCHRESKFYGILQILLPLGVSAFNPLRERCLLPTSSSQHGSPVPILHTVRPLPPLLTNFPYSWQEILLGSDIFNVTQRLLSRTLQPAFWQMPTFLPSPGERTACFLWKAKYNSLCSPNFGGDE